MISLAHSSHNNICVPNMKPFSNVEPLLANLFQGYKIGGKDSKQRTVLKTVKKKKKVFETSAHLKITSSSSAPSKNSSLFDVKAQN